MTEYFIENCSVKDKDGLTLHYLYLSYILDGLEAIRRGAAFLLLNYLILV